MICPDCGYTSMDETVCPHCGEQLEKEAICEVCGAVLPDSKAVGHKHTVCPECAAKRSTEDMRRYLREQRLWEDFCLYWIAGYPQAGKVPAEIRDELLRFTAGKLAMGDEKYTKALWEYVQEDISDYTDWRMEHEATDAENTQAS